MKIKENAVHHDEVAINEKFTNLYNKLKADGFVYLVELAGSQKGSEVVQSTLFYKYTSFLDSLRKNKINKKITLTFKDIIKLYDIYQDFINKLKYDTAYTNREAVFNKISEFKDFCISKGLQWR